MSYVSENANVYGYYLTFTAGRVFVKLLNHLKIYHFFRF